MKRKIITTGDGSKTIHLEEWNEQYHSVHGAIQEANHVYIKHGLLFFINEMKSPSDLNQNDPISILEIGFGTGLNAFLSFLNAEKNKLQIKYTGVEGFPLEKEDIDALNYSQLLAKAHQGTFNKLHSMPWEKETQLTSNFSLKKEKKLFSEITAISEYDIIFFDAFGPDVQPELWTESIFQIMYKALKPKGVLTTYSSKGDAKRAMRAVGFKVKRLEGPPHKRHMVRAIKR